MKPKSGKARRALFILFIIYCAVMLLLLFARSSRYVGGIVSVNGSNSQINGMTNTGLVAAFGKNAAYVGGIVGGAAGTLHLAVI